MDLFWTAWYAFMALVGALVAVGLVLMTIDAVRKRRRSKPETEARLRAKLRSATVTNGRYELDAADYPKLSTAEIKAVAAEEGFRFVGPGARTRLLFAPVLAEAPDQAASFSSPEAALVAELRAAQPDVRGVYRLHTDRYPTLELERIRDVARANGWRIVSFDGSAKARILLLARQGANVVGALDPLFPQGPGPQELRAHPLGAELAERYRRERGFDPLSPAEWEQARAQEAYWYKRFRRWVVLATLVPLLVGVPCLAFGAQASARDDGITGYLLVGAAVVVVTLAGAMAAVRTNRRRRAAVGHLLDAYQEISRAVIAATRAGRSGDQR